MSGRLGSQKRSVGSLNYIRMALRARGPFALVAIAIAVIGLAANVSGVGGLFQAAIHPVSAFCLVGLAVAGLATPFSLSQVSMRKRS